MPQQGTDSVVVIDSATNTATGFPIGVGDQPNDIAVNPNGTRAYVPNSGSTDDLSVINTTTNATGPAIPLNPGDIPFSIAVNPAGTRGYVTAQGNGEVQAVDLVNNVLVGSPIAIPEPREPAFSPDGSRAFVPSVTNNNVTVLNTASFSTVGSPIPLNGPFGTAITPDGRRLYVTTPSGSAVSMIDTATNSVVGPPIMVGAIPRGIAITPDGSRAYVANRGANTVSVIDLASNSVVGQPIPVGVLPTGVAISPDGSRAYVTNASAGASSVSVIAIPSDTVVTTIPLANGSSPQAVAVTPNQGPTAAFSAGGANATVPTTFDGSGSSDPDGSVAHYAWDFGDGSALADGGATPAHTYATPGNYTVTLTVTDNEGCSTQFIFTGQTASCNGKPSASIASQVSVGPAPPDTSPPQATIGKLKKKYDTAKVKIRFSASEPDSTFTCKLDRKPAKACTSPVVYKHLKAGKHKFTLVATDEAGNAGAPVNARFKVVSKGD